MLWIKKFDDLKFYISFKATLANMNPKLDKYFEITLL